MIKVEVCVEFGLETSVDVVMCWLMLIKNNRFRAVVCWLMKSVGLKTIGLEQLCVGL